MTKQPNNSKAEKKKDQAERLAQALRDNLKRRKTQAKKTTHNDVKDN